MKTKFIFEEMKLVGMRDHTGQWWKVIQDCVRCGQCCLDRTSGWYFVKDELLGGCRYLEEEGEHYRCLLGMHRPFLCCCNSPFSTVDYCAVRMEKIETPEEMLK